MGQTLRQEARERQNQPRMNTQLHGGESRKGTLKPDRDPVAPRDGSANQGWPPARGEVKRPRVSAQGRFILEISPDVGGGGHCRARSACAEYGPPRQEPRPPE